MCFISIRFVHLSHFWSRKCWMCNSNDSLSLMQTSPDLNVCSAYTRAFIWNIRPLNHTYSCNLLFLWVGYTFSTVCVYAGVCVCMYYRVYSAWMYTLWFYACPLTHEFPSPLRCVQEYKLGSDGRSCVLQKENCEGPKCQRQDVRFNDTLFGEMLHGYNNKSQQVNLGQVFQMTFR